MRTILTFTLSALLLPCFAQNMVVNGDFEEHSLYTWVVDPLYLTQCFGSINTGFISPDLIGGLNTYSINSVTGVASGYFLYFYDDCEMYTDTSHTTTYQYGETPPSGTYYAGVGAYSDQNYDSQLGITFPLSTSVNSNVWYKLSYYFKVLPTLSPAYTYHEGNVFVSFALGNDSVNFGTQILHTSSLPDSVWRKQTVVFQANDDYSYLSLLTTPTDTGWNGLLVDHIVLTTDTATSVQEYVQEPKLVRIVDMLGRETQPKKNTPLFYLFDDGTVEKRLVIE